MSRQAEPKRTISKVDVTSTCAYTRARPYKGCTARAEYLMTVETQGSEKRGPMTMRYRYCEEHVPWEKVSPRATPGLPVDAISTQEAADTIGIPIMTLHQWRGRGKGPKSTKARGRCWYSRHEVERWAAAWRVVNHLAE